MAMKRTCLSVMQSTLAIAVALGCATPGWAMPNFARQTSMSCDGCHTVIPRLSEDGFQFCKAGFRMPSDLGKRMEISFGHVFAARIQGRYDLKHRDDSGTKSTNSQITLHEITLYPLSGAFGKN